MPYTKLGDLQTLTLNNNVKCDNPCCILTLDCIVTLMGNMELENFNCNEAVATLPSSMRPNNTIMTQAWIDNEYCQIQITNQGEIKIIKNNASLTATLYFNGLTFNICDKYYNDDKGNNFPQGTSPIRWDGSDW